MYTYTYFYTEIIFILHPPRNIYKHDFVNKDLKNAFKLVIMKVISSVSDFRL